MRTTTHSLKDGRELLIREAVADDAAEMLEYVNRVAGETTNLSFGPGEFELTVEQEAAFVEESLAAANCVYLLGLIEGRIVSALHFGAGKRERVKHCGEFGMSVEEDCWGLGIGGLMLDALIQWARDSGVVTKINLRVRNDNQRAIQLYERRGFVREGTLRRDFVVDGEYFDHHMMGLDL